MGKNMEGTMSGAKRRREIMALLGRSSRPLSGTALGEKLGVSRQVVVQDIALLRTEGKSILATARGYVLDEPQKASRVLKVCHTELQTEDELNTIVDMGGAVLDVMVNHRIYGKVTAPLNIRSRRDVQAFLTRLRTGKSAPLMNVTSGYHFHRISADSDEILDEIECALREKKFLAERFPYESEE